MIIVISIKLFVKGFKQILSEALDNGSKLLDKSNRQRHEIPKRQLING